MISEKARQIFFVNMILLVPSATFGCSAVVQLLAQSEGIDPSSIHVIMFALLVILAACVIGVHISVLQTLLRVVQLAYDRYLVTVVQYEFNLQEATMGYNALSAMQQQVCKALDFPLAIVVAASVFGTAPYLVWVVTMSILSHGRAILLVEALSLGPGFCTVVHCLFLMLGITSKAELLPHVMKSLHFHGDSTIDHCTIVGYMANLRSGFVLLGLPVTVQTCGKITWVLVAAMVYLILPLDAMREELSAIWR
jgi:hypothetical protein